MKITIFGSSGMAGHMISSYLKKHGYNVTDIDRSIVDVEDKNQIDNFFNTENPKSDFIINCIGLLVKESINRPDRATIINAWFPHYLEYKTSSSKTRVVHLSTDCVFDGIKGNYTEDDIHTEKNAYGRSKSYGELNNNKDITFRMSIIGPEIKDNGSGLLNWILKSKELEIPGWENAWWNGITTLELAKCIKKYIENPKITGIYHLVNNSNRINKFELLSKINEVYDLKKIILKTNGPKNINKLLIDTRKEFDFDIKDYDSMLKELKNV